MVVELVVLDERDRRLDAFFGRRHIDRTALAVLGHVLDLGARRLAFELLLDDDLRTEPHRAAHDNAESDLTDDLVPAAETFLPLAEHLDVVVQKADQPQPYGRDDHQLRIDVRQIAQQEDRNQNRQQNDQTAHRRRAPFLKLPLEAEIAHFLADLSALQQADDLPAENHADRQRQNDRHRRAERQREKHPHAGNVEMLRKILDQMV